MQRGFQAIPPVGIVFDCDLGNDVEDVLALALLYGLDGKNECRMVATTISKPNLKAAALSEVMGRFYAGTVSGAFPFFGRNLPVGLASGNRSAEDTPMFSVLAKQTAEGKPAYSHGIEKLSDTADPRDVFRNALSAQNAQNTILILAGPASNLAAAIKYPVLKPVIPDKTRNLVVAAGSYPDGKPDPVIQADIAAAKQLFAEWPTPIVAVGSEVGEAIPFPGTSIEKDFAWSPAHPVADAYKAHKPLPYDAPAAAMAAALYAVRPKDTLFQLSEPGTITVLDDGRTKFTPSAGGKHRYLIVDPAQKDKIQQVYVELASAKPVPRMPRRRFGQQQQNQQQQTPSPAKPKPEAQPRD
jgi:inosine-uridine nucleoside N-ribohydrolase